MGEMIIMGVTGDGRQVKVAEVARIDLTAPRPEPRAEVADAATAAAELRAGTAGAVVAVDGDGGPVLYLWNDGAGGIVCEAIAGWSAGVVEAVCAAESSYLDHFMRDTRTVVLVDPWPR